MTREEKPAQPFSPRERGFVRAIMAKYPDGQHDGKDLYRSVAIISAVVLAFHLIEQYVPTFWLPLLIVYPPTIWLFARYRRFSIFRSCVLSKVGARLSRYESLGGEGASHHPSARS